MAGLAFALVFIASLALSPARADIPEHMIKELPGWKGALPTTQYSGYIEINATTGKYLHYWCVCLVCRKANCDIYYGFENAYLLYPMQFVA